MKLKSINAVRLQQHGYCWRAQYQSAEPLATAVAFRIE